MAYSTGTAATTQDLFNALFAFAAANAGTSTGSRTLIPRISTADTAYTQKITKGSDAWYFRFETVDGVGTAPNQDTVRMVVTASSGVTETTWADIKDSATVSNASGSDVFCVPVAGAFATYHLFSDGSEVHMAFEMSPGQWNHLSFGVASIKYGTWTGGAYISGGAYPKPPSLLAVTSLPYGGYAGGDGVTIGSMGVIFDRLQFMMKFSNGSYKTLFAGGNGSQYYTPARNTGPNGGASSEWWTFALNGAQPNVFNVRSALLPIEFVAGDSATSPTYYSMLAALATARWVNLTYLAPEQTVNTDWIVFPLSGKSTYAGPGSTGIFNSFVTGIAFKK